MHREFIVKFLFLFNFLKGIQRTQEAKIEAAAAVPKPRGFEELDVLGDALMKQNLSANSKPIPGFHPKAPEKVPLNMLAKKKMQDEVVTSKEIAGNLWQNTRLLNIKS